MKHAMQDLEWQEAVWRQRMRNAGDAISRWGWMTVAALLLSIGWPPARGLVIGCLFVCACSGVRYARAWRRLKEVAS